MFKSLVIAHLLSFTIVLKSQVTVNGAKNLLKDFENSTLNIVGADTVSQKMYLMIIKDELPFKKIVFLKEDNFINYLRLNDYYLANVKINVQGDNGYLRSWSSLTVFKATQRIINVISKSKDLNYSTISPSIEFPIEAKRFDVNETSIAGISSNSDTLYRYNFGVFKNDLQQVRDACEKGDDRVFSKDYSDKEKLSVLKQDTLFIVQDNPERNYLPDLFHNHYPYKYKFISNTSLENFILNSNKDFYYLHFDYSQIRMANQISIVNSRSGNQIFHDQSLTPDLLSERMLKMIVEKIEAK